MELCSLPPLTLKHASLPQSSLPSATWIQSTFLDFKLSPTFWMLHAFFWVIPWLLNFICRLFGKHCLFHRRRWVGVKKDYVWEMLGYLYGKKVWLEQNFPRTFENENKYTSLNKIELTNPPFKTSIWLYYKNKKKNKIKSLLFLIYHDVHALSIFYITSAFFFDCTSTEITKC